MQTFFWALGPMLVLSVIIFYLRLGLTVKGKLFIAITSFLFALGGAAAVVSIPLWQTALMLVLLIFVVAYFMDSRFGQLLYLENSSFEEKQIDDDQTSVFNNQGGISLNNNVSEKFELETLVPIGADYEDEKEFSIALTKVQNEIIIDTDHSTEVIDDEIAFLIERNIEDKEVELKVSEPQIGYLSDLETLLVEETLEGKEQKETLIDDSLFDFLLAQKEVAADRNVSLDEMAPKEKVSLQK